MSGEQDVTAGQQHVRAEKTREAGNPQAGVMEAMGAAYSYVTVGDLAKASGALCSAALAFRRADDDSPDVMGAIVANHLAEAAVGIAEQTEAPLAQAVAHHTHGKTELALGDFVTAEQAQTIALELLGPIYSTHPGFFAEVSFHLARARHELGYQEVAEGNAREALRDMEAADAALEPNLPSWRTGTLMWLAEVVYPTDKGEAARLLRQAEELITKHDLPLRRADLVKLKQKLT